MIILSFVSYTQEIFCDNKCEIREVQSVVFDSFSTVLKGSRFLKKIMFEHVLEMALTSFMTVKMP